MVCAPIATLALIGSLTGGANAAILFNFQEVGGGVVMTSSGSIDTAGLVSTFSEGWGGAGFESGVTDIMGGGTE